MKYDKHLKPENRIRRASTARDKLLRQRQLARRERERDENEGGVEQDVEVVQIEINQCKASEQLPQGKREWSGR